MLIDGFGRRIDYLRLSVTDRCDLRCSYCMPDGFHSDDEPREWLTFDELERLAGIFVRQGIERIRLTGGEPFLRRNLSDLAGRIARLPGLGDLSLSTNGTQLSKYAEKLRQSGVNRINVSLDSLDPARVLAISRRDVLPQVLEGLESAAQLGFSQIKINMVVLPDTSEQDIIDMAAYCAENSFILRLIETMPVGQRLGFVDLQPIRRRLRERFGLIDGLVAGAGPARYMVSGDGRFKIGFITALSQHFCDTCNRIRLSANGTLHLCLGRNEDVDFRGLMRSGASDEEIAHALRHSLGRKPERHDFRNKSEHVLRMMSSTGG
ncbi:MAG: GTP 3',8-cyclase MoaA [Telluria sp.]